MSLSTAQLTNLYLYGQDTTPSSLISDVLIRTAAATSSATIDRGEFMSTGSGRFAKGAQFDLVEAFFSAGSITLGSVEKFI